MKELKLKPGKEKSLQRKHHWIFSGALQHIKDRPEEGEMVKLLSSKDETLAFGHYGKKSIAVRVLKFGQEIDAKTFWKEKLSKAIEMRSKLQLSDTNALRLIHGEGDGLPGLVVDRYADHLVLQFHSRGMQNAEKEIKSAFRDLLGEEITFHSRSAERNAAKQDSVHVEALEHGIKLKIDVTGGQKTGFFLDQRDNRLLLRQMSKDRSVLNVFSYTGGFSVAAQLGDAKEVCSVDLSEPAMKLCQENIAMNKTEQPFSHQAITKDAFDFISNDDLNYDVIVLDPPAFAKHLSAKKNALRAYRRLNGNTMKKMRAGTFLFTFSCSQVVSKQDFHYMILNASADAGRAVRILRELHQAADHPVNIYHPETEYLKGYLLYVE